MTPEEPLTGTPNPSRTGWQWSVVVSRFDDEVHLICVDVVNKAYVATELWTASVRRIMECGPEMFWGYISRVIQGMSWDLEDRIQR